jgi:hypothetical protein
MNIVRVEGPSLCCSIAGPISRRILQDFVVFTLRLNEKKQSGKSEGDKVRNNALNHVIWVLPPYTLFALAFYAMFMFVCAGQRRCPDV